MTFGGKTETVSVLSTSALYALAAPSTRHGFATVLPRGGPDRVRDQAGSEAHDLAAGQVVTRGGAVYVYIGLRLHRRCSRV